MHGQPLPQRKDWALPYLFTNDFKYPLSLHQMFIEYFLCAGVGWGPAQESDCPQVRLVTHAVTHV